MNASRSKSIAALLPSAWRYLVFFLFTAFVVTCSFLLFFTGLELPPEVIRGSAPKTFGNVLILSLLLFLLDVVRRKLTVERPVRQILNATQQITQGDFSVRVPPLPSFAGEAFQAIGENFNKMAQELSGTETLRTDFVANVSHELKTPLAVIQNYATMLQTPELPEAARLEYARAAAAASRRLSELITNILRLSKLENQQIYPEPQVYDLGEQLCRCLLPFESIWESKSLELGTDLQEGITVEADEELLALVWSNLLSNAMKFTPPNGRVSVRLRLEGDYAVVQVTDTGCGIRPEDGTRIFEKFYQADKSHTTQGNGLGLALVKRVIDITGSEITVESTPGKGSTFTVRLRREPNGKADIHSQ